MTALFLTALLAASPARAELRGRPADRIESLIHAASEEAPPSVPAEPDHTAVSVAGTPPEEPLIPFELWDGLKAPDAEALETLASRIPGLDVRQVREMTFATVDPIVAEAARRGYSALEVFTDEGLKGPQVYYLSEELVKRVFTRYDIRTITMDEGVDEDGRPFHLQALLMGAGGLELLYDRDEFTYENPWFNDHKYIGSGRVTERILGPADMAIDGVRVAMIFHPRIERFVKVSPTEVKVETNWGSRVKPLDPIRRLGLEAGP